MSKSIQEALELPALEDLLKTARPSKDDLKSEEISDEVAEEQEDQEKTTTMAVALGAGALPAEVLERQQAKDHEDAMDSLHDETLQHAQDLMDLGYNVDTRSSARIFETAASMFKLAMDAKNSKRDAQLKAQKLMLDHRKLDMLARGGQDAPQAGSGEAQNVIVEDRNELLKRLRQDATK